MASINDTNSWHNVTSTDARLNATAASSTTTVIVAILKWFTVASIIAAVAFNFLVLLAYSRHSSLRTPFNVYIANLCILDIIMALTLMSGGVVVNFIGYWPYSGLACSLYQYAGVTFLAANRWGHVLLSINRVWAVTFPTHYRHHHTKRLAAVMIGLSWALAHILCVPIIVLGRENTPISQADRVCRVDRSHQFTYAFTVELLTFSIPEVVMVLANLFIFLKLWRRRIGGEPRKRKKHAVSMSESGKSMDTDVKVVPDSVTVASAKFNVMRRQARNRNLLLAYMVITVVVCWTPDDVFYLLVDLIPGYWDRDFHALTHIVMYAHGWINPLLCYFAMDDLRNAVNKVILRPFIG